MQSLLDPITLSRIKDLPLVAKTLAHGFLHGLHASQQRGTGVEFNQYRSYEPGDPLAQIDWKLFARSDKYFVSEAQRESDIRVWLILDASASMLQISQKTKQQGGWNKLQYAKSLLATIAYLAQHQGDAVGLLSASSQAVSYLPANTGQRHWRRLLVNLHNISSGGQFPDIESLRAHIASVRSQGLVIVASDFYQHNQELVSFISGLSNRKTDVIAVQLECDDEIDFPYKGQIRFEDLESQKQTLLWAQHAKKDYLSARDSFNLELENTLTASHIQLLRANIDRPMDSTLLDFLRARQKLA
ncbi:DUF58 domain-containing protein [Aliiglaciecola litoralis]|uniref:DUF58 domain-containing protein n=1 Tax=Aliiglaciecola litoralis TaxID=582857 RepID=A0ABN1LNZ0_9ALTE